MAFDHSHQPAEDGGTTLTHEVRIRGALTPRFAALIGRPAARGLPEAMHRLAAPAEQDERAAA